MGVSLSGLLPASVTQACRNPAFSPQSPRKMNQFPSWVGRAGWSHGSFGEEMGAPKVQDNVPRVIVEAGISGLASDSGSTLVPLNPPGHSALLILHHTPNCWILNTSGFICRPPPGTLFCTELYALHLAQVCESRRPHLSHDDNQTSLRVKRASRRHSRFSVITTIITRVT